MFYHWEQLESIWCLFHLRQNVPTTKWCGGKQSQLNCCFKWWLMDLKIIKKTLKSCFVWNTAQVHLLNDNAVMHLPDVWPFYLCCCSITTNSKCDKSQSECQMDVLKTVINYFLIGFLLGQSGLREAISMSCITNGSAGSRKPSHSPSVPISKKETLSSAAKRYTLKKHKQTQKETPLPNVKKVMNFFRSLNAETKFCIQHVDF